MGTRANTRKTVSAVHAAYSKYRSKQIYLSDLRGALPTAKKTDSEALNFAGAVARTLGERALSLDLWQRAVALDERNSNALCNLSLWYREADDLASSLRHAIAARDIDPTPKTWNQLGVAYYNLRQQANAVVAYREALQLDENHAEAWANLGNALKDLHKTHEADEAFDRCLAVKPDYAWAIACQAHVKQKLAQRDAACLLTQRALALDPQNAELWLTSLMVNLPLRPPSEDEGQRNIIEFRDYIGRLRAWTESKPENLAKLGERVGYSQPYYIAYRDGNHAPTLSLYGKLMSEAVNAFRPQKATAPRTNNGTRKIKLAIVSGFFFRHSAWDVIIKGIVLNLDRSMFELDLYYTGTMVDDQTTLAKDNCDLFVQGPKTHKAWMELLSQRGYDAILYSEIGMDPFSMHLACLRLAPLQMLTWGHPMTSGLPTIDWYLSGELLESEDADHHYSEKLIRLPGTGVCTSPLEIRPKPVVFKFDRERVPGTRCKLYLCQHAFKYTDSAIKLIADIALAIPESDFFVVRDSKYPEAFQSAVDAMRIDFQQRGLAFDNRVFFLPWMNREQFLGSFSSVDIYLDLPGFSGYTTAWQAISQGLPVVTLQGKYLRQRLASGLLKRIGRDEDIAINAEEYILKVKYLCDLYSGRPQEWKKFRVEIKQRYEKVNGDLDTIRVLENKIEDHFESEKIIDAKNRKNSPNKVDMRKEVILINQLSDIDAIVENIQLVKNRTPICFDPFVFENAWLKKLNTVELKKIKFNSNDQAKNVTESYSRASMLDIKLREIRAEIFKDIEHPGWDLDLFFMFFLTALTSKSFAKGVGSILNEYKSVAMVEPDFPMELYFDSKINTSIIKNLSDQIKILFKYNKGRQWRPDYNEWTFDFREIEGKILGGQIDALVHIPTCFHNREFFSNYIYKADQNIFELPSMLWDVPLRRKNPVRFIRWKTLVNLEEEVLIDEYANRSRKIIFENIYDVLKDEPLTKMQTEYFIERCKRQVATYILLKRCVSTSPKIYLSDHNIGLNGPLLSLARLRDSEVIVFPHSSVTKSNSFLPYHKKMLLLQGAGYGTNPLSICNQPIKIAKHKELSQYAKYVKRERCSVVCLLLNSLYGAGQSYEDAISLRDLYKEMKTRCDESGVRLIVRAKPSGAPVNLLAQLLNIPLSEVIELASKPMEEIVTITDVCLMYGEPTSGLNLFLSSGAYTFASWSQSMPMKHWGGEFLRAGLIPFVNENECTSYLSNLFQAEQFRKYLNIQKTEFSYFRERND